MKSVDIKTNGVKLHALEEGEGPLVLMIHGFPGLAWSWRHQLPALASAGYRAVAIDSLGYGGSDRPSEAEYYHSDKMQSYLLGVLDHYGAEQAFIVGQDFGSQYSWNLAVRSPDRVRALAASVPYDYDVAGRGMLGSKPLKAAGEPPEPIVASPDHKPSERFVEMTRHSFVHFHYFQEVGPAERELAKNMREFLRRMYYGLSAEGALISKVQATAAEGNGYMDALPDVPPLPWRWMTEDEFERIVEDFDHPDPMKRFIGGLNSYRTADANWEIGLPWADADVDVPTLFIYGQKDPAFNFFPDWESRLRRRVPGLRRIVDIPHAGHNVQQEQPEVFNAALLDFFNGFL
jgi:pimeloyl-ACP methyl ester carboxylesterase